MKTYSGIQTGFTEHVCPEPNSAGDHGGTRDGYDIPGGEKGTPGVMKEVTTVDVPGGPGIGDHVNIADVANKKKQ